MGKDFLGNSVMIKGLLLFCLMLPLSAAYSQADPFSNDVTGFSSTEEIPGHKVVTPISIDGINFFIVKVQEKRSSLETMNGEDVDGNGVRDDVQNAINEKYINNDYLRTRSLLMAEYLQQVVVGQTSNVINVLTQVYHLENCINLYGADEDGQAFVMPLVLNTYQRSIAFLERARDAIAIAGTPEATNCHG